MTFQVQWIGDLYAQRLQEKALLQTWPSTKGLFTGEGELWAKLKQDPKDKKCSDQELSGKVGNCGEEYLTRGLSYKVCKQVEEMLCWAFEIAIQEKRRQRNWH